MKKNQRVVKSVPDRNGNNYTKTANGGKGRMQAATRYMDEREQTQLYTRDEAGQVRETDRHEAARRIEDSETKYQQHLVFTTALHAENTAVNEREAAERVAKSIQERRPDAEIYAISVHSDGKGEEKNIHVHVAVGTKTTLQKSDLTHFREEAYRLEKTLERENTRELSPAEREVVDEIRYQRQPERQHQRHEEERGRE